MLNLTSTKEELMKLRRVLRPLSRAVTDKDGRGLLRTTAALWEKWLSVLEAAGEWEMWCEELKQDWKFVSEGVSGSFPTVEQYGFLNKRRLNCFVTFILSLFTMSLQPLSFVCITYVLHINVYRSQVL